MNENVLHLPITQSGSEEALAHPDTLDAKKLVEAVEADLKGRVTVEQVALLQRNPTAVLSLLRNIRADVRAQQESRKRAIDSSLREPRDQANWSAAMQKYRAWLRKTNFFLKKVQVRIDQIELVAPEAQLRLALKEGLEINPEDSSGIRAWQDKVRALLA